MFAYLLGCYFTIADCNRSICNQLYSAISNCCNHLKRLLHSLYTCAHRYDRTRVPTFPISEASLFNLKVDTRLTPVQQQLLNDVEMEWSSDKSKTSKFNTFDMSCVLYIIKHTLYVLVLACVSVVVEFIGMVPKLLQDGGEKMAERLIQKGGRNGGGSVLKNSFCRKMKRLSLLMQQDEEDQEEVNVRQSHVLHVQDEYILDYMSTIKHAVADCSVGRRKLLF